MFYFVGRAVFKKIIQIWSFTTLYLTVELSLILLFLLKVAFWICCTSKDRRWCASLCYPNSDLQAGIWFGRVAPTLQCRSSCQYPCYISDCVVHLIVCTHVLFIDCDCTVVWWLARALTNEYLLVLTFVLKPTHTKPSSRGFVVEP